MGSMDRLRDAALVCFVSLLLVAGSAPAWALEAGLSDHRFADGQRYYLQVSKKALAAPTRAKLLVSIHGFSGRKDTKEGRATAQRAATRWKSLARKQGWVVLAPHFEEERFENNYQRLNLKGRVRSDLRLHELVDEVGKLLPGLDTLQFHLFGFSGGGQFVHRYTAFHPERVLRAVAGGAGWYLWPDATLPHPIGLEGSGLPEGAMKSLVGSKLLVLLGQDDTDGGDFRKVYKSRYDLVKLQGPGRRQRGEAWVRALEVLAGREGWPFAVRFEAVPGVGHKIPKVYKARVAAFLTEQ